MAHCFLQAKLKEIKEVYSQRFLYVLKIHVLYRKNSKTKVITYFPIFFHEDCDQNV